MHKQKIIDAVKKDVQKKLSGEGSGHDWFHIERVWKIAKSIAHEEKADSFVVELAALLHDIADWKFNKGNLNAGPAAAAKILKKYKVDGKVISEVVEIIRKTSFKGAGVPDAALSLEGKIVRDSDRLDALGAIGIARCFAYGGFVGREIYNPKIAPHKHGSFKAYSNSRSPSLNHFYEKLFLLKDRMHTKTARRLAANRHKFMENYLKEFFKEWQGRI